MERIEGIVKIEGIVVGPKVSAVIPAYNESEDIGACVKSLADQDYLNLEIIVVDDGSTDDTYGIAERLGAKVIKGEHKGPGFSRNLGAKQAKGDILLFVDADMIFPKDYVTNIITPLVKGGAVGSEEFKQLASNVFNVWSQCWGAYAKENNPNLGKIFRAIRKDKFFEWGGFNPKYGYADDMTFYIERGVNSVIAREAWCWHKNPSTLNEVYKQSRWIGASLNIPFSQVPLLRSFIPWSLYTIYPIALVPLSLRQTIRVRKLKLFFNMFAFISARYLGTVAGIRNRIKGSNVR